MPDLIAQGASSGQRWRRELPNPASGIEIVLGRAEADWTVPWDAMISRRHVRLTAKDGDRVEVIRDPTARNPVFYRGQNTDHFVLVPGDHFVIGHTTFTLANRPGASDSSRDHDADVTSHAYDPALLRKRHFRDAGSRIEMLSRLPDLIAGSVSDEELLVRVTGVLLQATTSASAVAVVAVAEDGQVRVLQYDSRVPGTDGPPVSARLVRASVTQLESVLHLWAGGRRENAAFTASEDVDWAFCVPLRSEACPGWALYVTGQLMPDPTGDVSRSLQAAPENLEDDVKFAELVGTTIANLRQARRLERRQAGMRRFFAPVVMDALASRGTEEVLSPREADLSVLFCDLRGFSARSEQHSHDLLQLLARVSDALGVMTRHILETGGVIGDFHGDAAMGFWGWPLQQRDAAHRAAEAAQRIREEYRAGDDDKPGDATKPDHPHTAGPGRAGFRCGIGIASGRAVAGRIGTTDQVKVTAFGPVVNLASRLEGITKAFGAEIIIDEATATALRQTAATKTTADQAANPGQAANPDPGQSAAQGEEPTIRPAQRPIRLRRLARVRPAGMVEALEVSELLCSHPPDDRALSDDHIRSYERSLDALIAGDWNRAYELLHSLPAWDRPKDLLISTILQHNRVPPEHWDGVIDLPKL